MCKEPKQKGHEKSGWHAMALLVPSTTFDNGNAKKLPFQFFNKLNWTRLLAENQTGLQKIGLSLFLCVPLSMVLKCSFSCPPYAPLNLQLISRNRDVPCCTLNCYIVLLWLEFPFPLHILNLLYTQSLQLIGCDIHYFIKLSITIYTKLTGALQLHACINSQDVLW